jgi:hypothetical protein
MSFLSNKAAVRRPVFWAFLLTMALAAFLWSGTLRSDATPYGDGSRIMKFIQFAHGLETFPALWDPYRNGGYPLFGNPEHFWLLSLLIDPAGSQANLLLNGALFTQLLIVVALAWAVARQAGLSRVWAAIAALTIGFNEHTILMEQSARFQPITMLSSLLLIYWALLGKQLRPGHYILLVVTLAICFVEVGYYVLLPGLLIYSHFLFSRGWNYDEPLLHLLRQTAKTLLIGTTAFLLSAMWSFPLISHFAHSFVPPGQLIYEPNVYNLLGMVIPDFSPGKLYVTFLLIPALGLIYSRGLPLDIGRRLRGYCLPAIALAVYSLMAIPYVGDTLQAGYSHLPFISGLRHHSVYVMLMLPALTLGTLLILQRYQAVTLNELGTKYRVYMATFLFAAAYSVYHMAQQMKFSPAIPAGATLLAAAGFMTMGLYATASGLPSLRLGFLENLSVKRSSSILFVLSLLAIGPQAFLEKLPENGRKLHVSNQPANGQAFEIIKNDPEPYFRFYRGKKNSMLDFLHASERGDSAFSYLFPTAWAYSLSYLSPEYDLNVNRPHWVKDVPCSDLDPLALDMLAIKYLICPAPKNGDPIQMEGWESILVENRTVLLRRTNFDGGIRFYCNWDKTAALPLSEARLTVLAAYRNGMATLDTATPGFTEPQRDPACPETNMNSATIKIVTDQPGRLVLTVDAPYDGLVVVPDNFDNGWQATVNGKEWPVLRAFMSHMAIPVAKGHNELRFEYKDRALLLGLAVSLLTLVSMFVYWIIVRSRAIKP